MNLSPFIGIAASQLGAALRKCISIDLFYTNKALP